MKYYNVGGRLVNEKKSRESETHKALYHKTRYMLNAYFVQ